MSGHSKWSTIKHKKAKIDAQRGVAFAKYSREIIVAAKLGGGDLNGNFRLRTAVDKAKAAGVPNDNIKRAIDKAVKGNDSDNFEELTYEGYGAGGVAVFIEALTDNRNRTAGDIRSYFTKFNGNLGENGCVSWMFKQFGVLTFNKTDYTYDQLFELSMEIEALDVLDEEDESEYKILCLPENFQKTVEFFESKNLKPNSSELTRIAENTIEISDPKIATSILRLMEKIEENDDVQNVYSNFEFSDDVISELNL